MARNLHSAARACLLGAFAATIALAPLTAVGADRVVICEEFTNNG